MHTDLKPIDLPPPRNPLGYTVKESCPILQLKAVQVSNLFKAFGVKKIKNSYYATPDELLTIMRRENRCLKEYDI